MINDKPICIVSTNRQCGFTLIETIAVLLISGILISSLTLLTGQWLKSWDRGVKRLQTAEMLSVGINRLVADIEASLPLSTPGPKPNLSFIGSEETIVLTRTANERSNSPFLEFVKISAEPNGGILRERAPYDPLTPIETVETEHAVRLIDSSFTGSFEFKDDTEKWLNSWSAPTLPSSVRVLLKEQQSSYFEKISIVIGTKINVAANCATVTNYAACKALTLGQPQPAPGPTNTSPSNTQPINQNQGNN